MYFIKKSDFERVAREGYAGRSIREPKIHVIMEGAIPDNRGKGGTTLLFEHKHFEIVPDKDFSAFEVV